CVSGTPSSSSASTAWWYGPSPTCSYSSSERCFAAKPSRLSKKRVEARSSAGSRASVFESIFISIPISRNMVARPSVTFVYSWCLQRLEAVLDSQASTSFIRAALERPGTHRHRSVHGHSRCRDRECRTAVDQVRPRLLPGGPAVGHH